MRQKVLSLGVEPSAQKSVEALLLPEYEITSVETPQQAVSRIAARRPDAIVVTAFRSVDPLLPFFSALSMGRSATGLSMGRSATGLLMAPPLPLLLVAPVPFGVVSLLIEEVSCRCLRVPFTPSRLRAEMAEILRPDSAASDAPPFSSMGRSASGLSMGRSAPGLSMEQLAAEVAERIERSLASLKEFLSRSQERGGAPLFPRDLLPLLREGIEPLERLTRSLNAVRAPFRNRTQARRVSARPILFAERRKSERRADRSFLPNPF